MQTLSTTIAHDDSSAQLLRVPQWLGPQGRLMLDDDFVSHVPPDMLAFAKYGTSVASQ
jgi:hypothetical protein